MKKLFLVLCLFISLPSYSITENTTTRIKGVTKLAGSFVLGLATCILVSHAWENSRVSDQSFVLSDLFYPTYKRDCRELGVYQYNTALLWAFLAKQLYDSGMDDLTEDKKA